MQAPASFKHMNSVLLDWKKYVKKREKEGGGGWGWGGWGVGGVWVVCVCVCVWGGGGGSRKDNFSRKLDICQIYGNILVLLCIPATLQLLLHHCKPNIEWAAILINSFNLLITGHILLHLRLKLQEIASLVFERHAFIISILSCLW